MTSTEQLESRVYHLECQLANYHEQLEAALEHDRKFQMGATWGVVNTVNGFGAFILVLWLTDKLNFDGWVMGALAGIAAFVAWGAATVWSDKGRERDLLKLSRLPQWERHPSAVNDE